MERGIGVHRFRAAALTALTISMVLTSSALQGQAPPAAANAPAPLKASVDQLAWIAGPWTGTLGDRTIEQHWMAPLAGSMVGMYRSIRAGKPTLYELLAIEQDAEGGLVLRIKHFAPGPGLVGQEGKEESANHALVQLDGRRAVFENMTPTGPVRVTFSSPDAAALDIVVERTREGKPAATTFAYRRAAR